MITPLGDLGCNPFDFGDLRPHGPVEVEPAQPIGELGRLRIVRPDSRITLPEALDQTVLGPAGDGCVDGRCGEGGDVHA